MHTHNFLLQLFSFFLSWLRAFVGIIMISHDREFYSLVCPEVWEVADGRTKGVLWCTRNENELDWLMLPHTIKHSQLIIFSPGHGSNTKQIHVHSIFSSVYFIVDRFDSSNIFFCWDFTPYLFAPSTMPVAPFPRARPRRERLGGHPPRHPAKEGGAPFPNPHTDRTNTYTYI